MNEWNDFETSFTRQSVFMIAHHILAVCSLSLLSGTHLTLVVGRHNGRVQDLIPTLPI